MPKHTEEYDEDIDVFEDESDNIESDIDENDNEDGNSEKIEQDVEKTNEEGDDEEIGDEDEDEIDAEVGDSDEDLIAEEDEEPAPKHDKKKYIDKSKCVYSFIPKKSTDETIEEFKNSLKVLDNKVKYVDAKDRISKPFMTKYEYVRIIGDRTQQLILGAKPMIKNYKTYSPKERAIEELRLKMTPFFVEREMPNKTIEKWHINELDYIDN